MLTLEQWCQDASKQLHAAGIPSARLDAELILSKALQQTRAYLIVHAETTLESLSLETAETWLKRRLRREPLAYIFGSQEFYGRDFNVSPDVLIPRPESEAIIDSLKNIYTKKLSKKKILIDVGTGSGALAITAKLELPELQVIGTDISDKALVVASKNAKQLGANVAFLQSDLLASVAQSVDCIVANLPYVDESWEVSPETVFEPKQALFTPDKGLYLIKKLLPEARARLLKNGVLILEADPRQHDEIITFAKEHQFKLQQKKGLILEFKQ